MISTFENEALDYLLDDLAAPRRRQFEEQLTRYPAARIALEQCADLLAMVRRQATEFPSLGCPVPLAENPPARGASAHPFRRRSGLALRPATVQP